MNDCEGGADINKFKNKTFQQETQNEKLSGVLSENNLSKIVSFVHNYFHNFCLIP